MDDSATLLLTAGSSSAAGPGGRPGRSPGRPPREDAGGKGGALTCPFSTREGREGGAQGSGTGMCGFHASSVEALEAHTFEEHWWQLEALGTQVAMLGKVHGPSGLHVCPVRVMHPSAHSHPQSSQTGGRGSVVSTHGQQHHDHPAQQHGQGRMDDPSSEHFAVHHSSRELERHMQVHHIQALTVMGAFSKGLLADGQPGGGAGSTTVPARCLVCADKDEVPQSGPTGGAPTSKSLMSQKIAGPTHMLHHLGQAHPRRLLQVLHTAQMLAGA